MATSKIQTGLRLREDDEKVFIETLASLEKEVNLEKY